MVSLETYLELGEFMERVFKINDVVYVPVILQAVSRVGIKPGELSKARDQVIPRQDTVWTQARITKILTLQDGLVSSSREFYLMVDDGKSPFGRWVKEETVLDWIEEHDNERHKFFGFFSKS
jgi:hypothetical protein